jgi:hypothetical protein
MKAIITVKKEVDIKFVKVDVAVRYDEEDIPNDFPFRKGDMWSATIDIDAGKVLDWPKGQKGNLKMKICDQGSYYLLDVDGNILLSRENDYVPNELLPPYNGCGDYLELHIDENGTITNWYSKPSIENFILDND